VRGREFYLVGTYANVFNNGAIPPPPYYGVFVTKFDDRGELLWGHQYRAAPLEPYAGTTASADCLASYSAELADNGDVLVAATKGTSCMDTLPRSIVLRIQPDGTPRTQ
jgi:hypothetical protein